VKLPHLLAGYFLAVATAQSLTMAFDAQHNASIAKTEEPP
jgi:hypothetical protein